MLESEVRADLDKISDRVTGLAEGVEYPELMGSLHSDSAAVDLVEAAQLAAAQREFVGSRLADIRYQESLAKQMVKMVAERMADVKDGNLSTNFGRLSSRGMAAQERLAEANLSVAERMVDLRAAEYRLVQIEATTARVDAAWRAWRDAEFGIDRLVRIMQLRHALGEL